jgi:hypothetical protein
LELEKDMALVTQRISDLDRRCNDLLHVYATNLDGSKYNEFTQQNNDTHKETNPGIDGP